MTKKLGRKKAYKEKVKILHTLEAEMLARIDKLATYSTTRTDIINESIKQFIKGK